MLVLLLGIPGCAKSALCKEILNTPGGLGDNRLLHSLMGDLIKGMGHLGHYSMLSFHSGAKLCFGTEKVEWLEIVKLVGSGPKK
jgi:hypothetical protein